MLLKSIYSKVLITAFALSSSIATANDITKFKLVVIKKEFGYQNSYITTFNKNMSSCTELTKIKKATESEIACTAAITSVKSINTNTKRAKFLESLSYSNRGVSRYMNDDLSGAKDDLLTATLIDSNTITQSNLELLNRLVPDNKNLNKPTNIATNRNL